MDDLIQSDDRIKKIQDVIGNVKKDIGKTISSINSFASIILFIIGIYLFFTELDKFMKINSINKWKKVKGAKILDHYFETNNATTSYNIILANSSNVKTYYRQRVSFEYTYNNKKYISHKYSYFEPWLENPLEAGYLTTKYKKDAEYDFFINPNNPAESYLENVQYNEYQKIIIGSGLISLGLFMNS